MMTGVRSTEEGWTDNEIRYDGLAMRASNLDSTGFTYYDWDGMNVIQDKDGAGSVTDRQVHGYAPIISVGDIAHMDKSGTIYVPTSDQVGTVSNLLDASAAKANSYTYDAFGVRRHVNELVPNMYRFAGSKLAPDVDVYYTIANRYSPKTGRLLIPDALFQVRRRGRFYLYAEDNPIAVIDVTGEAGLGEFVAVVVVVALAGAIIIVASGRASERAVRFPINRAVLMHYGDNGNPQDGGLWHPYGKVEAGSILAEFIKGLPSAVAMVPMAQITYEKGKASQTVEIMGVKVDVTAGSWVSYTVSPAQCKAFVRVSKMCRAKWINPRTKELEIRYKSERVDGWYFRHPDFRHAIRRGAWDVEKQGL